MYKNQSGRSMVEMLGVLAIIGVLSIGGLSGYQMAVSQGKANIVLGDIHYLYISSLTQKQNQSSWTADDFNTTTLYPMIIKKGTQQYVCGGNTCGREVFITEVPTNVCNRLKQMLSQFSSDCSTDSNEMNIGFDTAGNFSQMQESGHSGGSGGDN